MQDSNLNIFDLYTFNLWFQLSALNRLWNIFGFGKHELEVITLDVTSKVYCKWLSQTFSSGGLKMADSKESFFQNLCDDLHFDP